MAMFIDFFSRHVPVPAAGAVAEGVGHGSRGHAEPAFPGTRTFQDVATGNHGRSHHGRPPRGALLITGQTALPI